MKKTLSVMVILALSVATEVANADFTFGTPTNLGQAVNEGNEDIDSSVSSDGLSLYFTSNRLGGYGGWDIWVATRNTVDDEWGPAMNLGSPVNSSSSEGSPRISADNLSLFFGSNRPGGYGSYDVWVATRAAVSAPWSAPVNLGPTINSPALEMPGNIAADGLTLYLSSDRPGSFGVQDLWVTTRATTAEPWGEPVNLGPTVNSSSNDGDPSVSADGLTLFFKSNRPGGLGAHDLYMTRRPTVSDPWSQPVNLGPPVNTSKGDELPNLSADSCTLYFSSPRSGTVGNYDLWQVSIDPIVDLNGDGKVDGFEVRKMVSHWGANEPSCDIGPTPFGDGIVDVRDLTVLAEYIGQPVGDSTLAAHWALDETEGITARNHVSANHGLVMGLPRWQPQSGAVDGALELNGTTFITANAVVNPAEGPFSVLAWVKGGAPGQAILAQGQSTWLMADAARGGLATELQGTGPSGGALSSPTVITDGAWHRVGFTWDGSSRRLYVDEILVAEDAQDGLAASSGRLILGSGKTMAPGTFWKGLIDDIRIYNRAVKP